MSNNFNFNDEDFIGFLKELLGSYLYEKGDDYDETFAGIAKRAIDNGWNSLSEKQKNVIRIRTEHICPERCSHCHDSIPWSEMLFAMEHDGICPRCVKVWGEMDNE